MDPQVVLEIRSLISFCAHFFPDAETIAAPTESARRKDRIMASETSGERKTEFSAGRSLVERNRLEASREEDYDIN